MMGEWKAPSGACRRKESLLEDYLEGVLESGARWELEAHISRCAACRDALERARSGTVLVRKACAPAADPGEEFTRGVMAHVARDRSRSEAERVAWKPVESFLVKLAFTTAVFTGLLISYVAWPQVLAGYAPGGTQKTAVDILPEPAHVTAASNDVLMDAIAEYHGR